MFVCRLLLVTFVLTIAPCAHGQDWTAFRGSDGTGTVSQSDVFPTEGSVDLKVRWKRKLGSGYSSVVVADSNVITMYCDGEKDYVICLDASNGETRWQTATGDSFKGENGSFDGPISTPLIHRGFVFALDPSGKMVCLRLTDGSEVWSKHLVDDFESTLPMYGFATSPVMAGDVLVLQTGAKDGSLAGLNPGNGDVLWKVTSDSINSQTPALMEFDGSVVVLAAGGKKLCGVNAADGKVLFEYEHDGGNGSAMVPVVMPDDNVVLTLDDGFSRSISLKLLESDKISVSQHWQERSIKNTYNVPVLCNGNLFAYSTRILTCVDSETGKPKWKSRQPGDGFLIAIDDHVVINTKKGSLHVARASDEGYQEVARMKLFDDLVWSLPAFGEGAIFSRSLGEIACVDIGRQGAGHWVGDITQIFLGAEFKELVERVGAESTTELRQKLVNEFMAKQNQFPIIEGDLVHFVFQGDAKDVAVASDIFGARQERPMKKLADTNLHYYAMRLPNDQRANYVFLVDYKPRLDPKNDRKVASSVYAGEMEFAVRLRNEKPLEMSWFAMNDWKQPEFLTDLGDEIKGKFVEHKIDDASESADARVYLPAGYDNSDTRYRTIYVLADPTYQSNGQLIFAMEKLVELDSGVDPAILVFPMFVPFGATPKSLAKELVPSIDRVFRTIADRSGRETVGFGMMAAGALTPVFENPETISRTSVYSPMVFDAGIRQIEKAMSNLKAPIDVYIEWGRFDMFNPHENWDVRKIATKIFEQCKASQKVNVRGGMVNDSGDWASWRNRYDKFMRR